MADAVVVDAIPWTLDVIKALGIGGGPVFATLWWLERVERRALQKETRDLLIQVLSVANQAANSVTAVTAAVRELGEGSKESFAALSQLMRRKT